MLWILKASVLRREADELTRDIVKVGSDMCSCFLCFRLELILIKRIFSGKDLEQANCREIKHKGRIIEFVVLENKLKGG